MVFRQKNRKTGKPFPTFKLRVTAPSGASAILSTGRTIKADADKVEAAYKTWRGDDGDRYARADVLELLVAEPKRIRLSDAYDAHRAGTLNELVLAAQERIAAELAAAAAAAAEQEAVAADPDLWPYVDAWVKWKAKQRRGGASVATYRKQLEVLYPTTQPFTLSMFTRKELKARLEALDVDNPTRNRYKAAPSSFGEYLLDQELLEINPARTIRGFGENAPRKIHYKIPDAKRLIEGLAQPYAAAAALMLGFCMEWGAIEETIREDVDLDAEPPVTDVRGTKTASLQRDTRRRMVPLVQELRWVLPFITPVLKGKLPGAKLFAGLTEWDMLRTQRAVARALAIHAVGEDTFGEHTLHDWRHTHAVAVLRWRYGPQIAADHLGHGTVDQVNRRYGFYDTERHDYARVEEENARRAATAGAKARSATSSATTTSRRRKGNDV